MPRSPSFSRARSLCPAPLLEKPNYVDNPPLERKRRFRYVRRPNHAATHPRLPALGAAGVRAAHRAHSHVGVHPGKEGLHRQLPRQAGTGDLRRDPRAATYLAASGTAIRRRPCTPATCTGTTIRTFRKGSISHTPDMVFIAPVFFEDELVAYCHSFAHFWDLGGSRPGSIGPANTEIFHDGTLVPTHQDRGPGQAERRGLSHHPAQFSLPRPAGRATAGR